MYNILKALTSNLKVITHRRTFGSKGYCKLFIKNESFNIFKISLFSYILEIMSPKYAELSKLHTYERI